MKGIDILEDGRLKLSRDVLPFSALLLAWVWIGGYSVHQAIGEDATAIFFLTSTLILPLVFLKLRGESLKDIGVHKGLGDRRLYTKILLAYFLLFGTIVLITNSSISDRSIDAVLLGQALLVMPLIFVIASVQSFMEEITWAGWLFDKISASYTLKTITIGTTWMIWHLPFYLWTDQFVELLPLRLEVLATLIIYFIALRFFFNWFRAHSGNALWATFAHGVVNTVGFLTVTVLGAPPEASAHLLMLTIAVANIIAVAILHRRWPPTG